jgi:hypothetical protein
VVEPLELSARHARMTVLGDVVHLSYFALQCATSCLVFPCRFVCRVICWIGSTSRVVMWGGRGGWCGRWRRRWAKAGVPIRRQRSMARGIPLLLRPVLPQCLLERLRLARLF